VITHLELSRREPNVIIDFGFSKMINGIRVVVVVVVVGSLLWVRCRSGVEGGKDQGPSDLRGPDPKPSVVVVVCVSGLMC